MLTGNTNCSKGINFYRKNKKSFRDYQKKTQTGIRDLELFSNLLFRKYFALQLLPTKFLPYQILLQLFLFPCICGYANHLPISYRAVLNLTVLVIFLHQQDLLHSGALSRLP